ncbi:alpha/beta hydrolase [Leucobacter rhizosphaerae]|uniref:Alpha/beta hydrolase n=1 Tax=Leucobacter rhizosphaerae TaxID=2932245 RepID=A0ABY4FSA8_9MICO|nr:alpha/beta hydrolase [Leucobacter rhizosphaerae]UOQ59142.1 alpha/beta hydrolase [Leucobacter rhizosphaerae]
MAPVQITDIVVPGPAAGREPGVPNRLGSAAVPVRVYSPEAEPWAELVWAHGGSFVRGTLDWPEADWVARSFAAAGVRVHSVDYVLASDTVHAPAPGNDVAAVLAAVAAQSDLPVVIGGASAGGHLAVLAALAQADRAAAGDGRAAAALILEYPTLHRVQRADPAIAAATAELPAQRRFDADRIAAMYADYLGAADPADVASADLADLAGTEAVVAGELPVDRLTLLPPTVIVNADADDLRASGEEFAEQLAIAGVRAVEYTQSGTVHGYLNRPDESAQARVDAADTIARFVAELRVILTANAPGPAEPAQP